MPPETLHNGIRLPPVWPPVVVESAPTASRPPYLTSPPNVIPIDLGRQLFVDDFLIERTTLTRTLHAAQFHPATPVLVPDTTPYTIIPMLGGISSAMSLALMMSAVVNESG